MTCIVGLEHNGDVYIGRDSSLADDWTTRPNGAEKLFRLEGRFLIGVTGDIKLCQIIQYNVRIPQQPDSIDDKTFMATVFVESIRKALKKQGYAVIKDSQENFDGRFLVGYHGHLYEFDDLLAFHMLSEKVTAIGWGFMFALGAMEALNDLEPEARIIRALEITEKFSQFILPPYHVEKL